MKNPLALPILLLMASLVLLAVAILMTPEIEVVEDPAFEQIVSAPGMPRPVPARIQETDAEATSDPEAEVRIDSIGNRMDPYAGMTPAPGNAAPVSP